MKGGHPGLLLWYVTGALSPRERRKIEEHLGRCGECRLEAASLASMMRSFRIQDRMAHVGAADLAEYEEEGASLGPLRRLPIERHLADCPACRWDLRTLRQARRRAGPGTVGRVARLFPTVPPLMIGSGVMAAAAAILVMAALWLPRFLPEVANPAVVKPRSAVFSAPTRGAGAPRSLRGPGPWSIRVVLPFGAEKGSYRIEVRRAGGSLHPNLAATASTDAQGCLTVLVPDLPGPGSYEMVLRRRPPGDRGAYLYPFELLPRSGAGPDS